MKAYLETVVVARKEGGDVSPSCSQVVLEFESWTHWDHFNEKFDPYEKAPNFEIFRTLIPMW
ncbi:conserved hypothetical protein [Edwardsiella phage PEi26]|uniref:Uncharacterized protein n=1 Tax=Edwardsiella phage PEi26 TaxID=1608311 RepID=A0A0B6VLN8_9CAUD|nr:conserved hypothetical protein [Edwardsiella phage PEi26]